MRTDRPTPTGIEVLGLYDSGPKPIAAFVISLISSILILLDGAILVFVGGVASDIGASAVGGVIAGLGYLGVFLGFLILLLSFALLFSPESHLPIGIAILVLAIFSIFGGGGFILGLIMGIIGGILAIIFDAEPESLPLFESERPPASLGSCPNCGTLILEGETACTFCHRPVRRPGAAPSAPRAPAAVTHPVPRGPVEQRPNIGCTRCGEIQPAAGAIQCRRCGAPIGSSSAAPAAP